MHVHNVPATLPMSDGRARMYVFEDNDAVIKMLIKGRNLALDAYLEHTDHTWIGYLTSYVQIQALILNSLAPNSKSQIF